MNIFENIQSMLTGGGDAGTGEKAGSAMGKLSDLLKSGAMGGISRNVLTNKNGDFSWLKTALIAGAGTMLWKKLTQRVAEANTAQNPRYGTGVASAEEQAERTIRAMIFAAKADGHIDDAEKAIINKKIASINSGREGKDLVQRAMSEPLDAGLVADGVNDPQEALGLYTMSRAIVNPDQYAERAYLDSLAQALNIPGDVRAQVDEQIRAAQSGVAQPAGF